ncbi:MAG: hypothetical protein KJ970_15385 [Candidatus Eisenbacteria bacterium]|uniref:Uncharacterized protein n=1 Tax=Eiseniibacteriota bacterium TaxID=2212470 RepID=A0A948W7J4_UNCEI|nr:hypothetical protein [Candidatus Eisenbacteria bacterium]MBU1948178.1 hypothetical protein [Candidatus Eisenbacteria bacterium]MBU2692305.1 hypothetical protein [Candidatus Eisenbacteria bacterium]
MRIQCRVRWGMVFFIIIPFLQLFTSCATVPKESVELSMAVEQRITEMQKSHETFVKEYFRLSRERIGDFIEYRWGPVFVENFVHDANLLPLLNQSTASGESDRIQILFEFVMAASEQIENQRKRMIVPLEKLERKTLEELRATYTELNSMQGSLTAFILSVHDIQVEQDRVLRHTGLLEKRDQIIAETISINDTILELIETGDDAEEVIARIQQIVDKQID